MGQDPSDGGDEEGAKLFHFTDETVQTDLRAARARAEVSGSGERREEVSSSGGDFVSLGELEANFQPVGTQGSQLLPESNVSYLCQTLARCVKPLLCQTLSTCVKH